MIFFSSSPSRTSHSTRKMNPWRDTGSWGLRPAPRLVGLRGQPRCLCLEIHPRAPRLKGRDEKPPKLKWAGLQHFKSISLLAFWGGELPRQAGGKSAAGPLHRTRDGEDVMMPSSAGQKISTFRNGGDVSFEEPLKKI